MSGRVAPPSGATFEGVVIGDEQSDVLVASDAGYGFVCQMKDLISNKKSGKTVLRCPKGAKLVTSLVIPDYEKDWIVSVSNEGRMLIFPISDLPRLARGKGNKIINIPTKRVADRVEFVSAMAVLSLDAVLTIHAGRRHHNLKPRDLDHYRGERGRRGNKLPRGFQNVDRISIAL